MDYTANIRAIIASFYVGTGGLDIGLILSAQGIAGGKSWEKTFSRYSPKICKSINRVTDQIIEESLVEEINLTIAEKLKGKYSESEIASLTQKFHKGIKTGVDQVDNVLISVSFDMGWQKKGTGHTYDSNSGHSYYIGCRSGKVIAMLVYSKKCTKCDVAIAMGEEPQDHEDCPRNYLTGSSKAMEASAALDLYLQLAGKGIGIEHIVSDDDSTMRAHLSHIGTHKHGMLPLHINQPVFLCDPSHRIKAMVKDVFALALSSKENSECEKIDALRLKKYLGCYVGKNKNLPFKQFENKKKAPTEHLFGCHEWCDKEWCYDKELEEARAKARTARTAAPSHPPAATIPGDGDACVATTQVINPTALPVCIDIAATVVPTHPQLLPLVMATPVWPPPRSQIPQISIHTLNLTLTLLIS